MAQLSPIQRNCRCFSLAQGALFFACAHTRYSQLGQHLHIHEYNSTQAFMSMTGCTMQLECLGEENILTITLNGLSHVPFWATDKSVHGLWILSVVIVLKFTNITSMCVVVCRQIPECGFLVGLILKVWAFFIFSFFRNV